MPSSSYKEIPITFEKGLVTEVEESLLDVGQASSLVNWEPSAVGALRTRNAYASITTSGLASPYSVRGFGAIATGTSATGSAGPAVIQTSRWPDGASTDTVATKTATLSGVTIGNVLVVVVCVDSVLAATTTGGWTERAISTGDKQQVRFFTQVAASSSASFTYTIASALIRSITMYEIADASSDDPGSEWAALNHNTGIGGTDTLTVNASDTDGGIALVGYTYDAGTPDSADGGTAGMTSTTLVNSNSRTGLAIQDYDNLDLQFTTAQLPGSQVTPSWTPPSTGTMLIVWQGPASTGLSISSVTGNGLTWNVVAGASGISAWGYVWADLNGGSTTGATTVTFTSTGGRFAGVSFYHLSGAPAGVNPVQQTISGAFADGSTNGPTLASNLQSSSGLISMASNNGSADATSTNVVPLTADWGNSSPDDLYTWTSVATTDAVFMTKSKESAATTLVKPQFVFNTGVTMNMVTLEILGDGAAAQDRYGTFATNGTVTESFAYIANKNLTAKMMVLGFTPSSAVSSAIEFYIVMAVATNSTTYKVYRVLRDEITSGTWELIDTVTDATSTAPWVTFAQGAGELVWSSTTLTAPRSITIATLNSSTVSDMLGFSGRAAAYHKDRMFLAGATDTPSRLFFSGIGDPTSFVTATDYLDIGGDDGEAIQDIISVEGLLLVAKTNRAYTVAGSGIESFFVNELPGGTAAPGRPVVRTPYGTILAGVDDVWVVQGGGVDPMSRPLGSGYVITGNVSTGYAQDSAVICDSGTGSTWRMNLVSGAWSMEEVGAGEQSNPIYNLFSLNGRYYHGTNGSTTEVGGTRKLSFDRTFDETTGGMSLRASTGRMALLGPSVLYTPRWLFMQVRSQDPTLPNELFVDVETNTGTRAYSLTCDESTQRKRLDIGWCKGAEWIKLSFSATSSADHAAIDVERLVLGVDAEVVR